MASCPCQKSYSSTETDLLNLEIRFDGSPVLHRAALLAVAHELLAAIEVGDACLRANFRGKLTVIYAYWDLVVGPRPAAGPRVAIGVDRPG
jgi:hypothetical protein